MKRTVFEVLDEVGKLLMGDSPQHRAAKRIAAALRDMEIPFAITDALAVGAHGHVRATSNVALLLTREGLDAFKKEWLGRGWVEKFAGSKGIRDAVENVAIDVLIAGDFPGDGKPKPVAFPDPAALIVDPAEALPVLPLSVLIELKLASGMTAAHRLQDLADVLALIKANGLGLEYAEKLDAYVREKYRELWRAAQSPDPISES